MMHRRGHAALAQLSAFVMLGGLCWAIIGSQDSYDMLPKEGTTNDSPRPGAEQGLESLNPLVSQTITVHTHL